MKDETRGWLVQTEHGDSHHHRSAQGTGRRKGQLPLLVGMVGRPRLPKIGQRVHDDLG